MGMTCKRPDPREELDMLSPLILALTVLGQSPQTSLGQRLVDTGLNLLGSPYLAHTLESDAEEHLIVNFNGFDCVTLVETCLASARCQHRTLVDDPCFRDELRRIRYDQGRIDGFGSRLHYVTAWIQDGEDKGLLVDMTKSLGGRAETRPIDFMSSHPGSYPKLSNPKQMRAVSNMEQRINARQRWVLPLAAVQAAEPHIQPGDIIALATTIEGLDVSHVGIAVRSNQRIHLLHASSQAGQVIVTPQPLADYATLIGHVNGIVVLRPKPTFPVAEQTKSR